MFQTPKYPIPDQKEISGINLTSGMLPQNWLNQFTGGKLPGVDGSIKIYDGDSHDTGYSITYQHKTVTRSGVVKHPIERSLLDLCLCNQTPIIFIMANLTDSEVYWEYVNSYYIRKAFKKLNKKFNTIKFNKKINNSNFIGKITSICKDHSKFVLDYTENKGLSEKELNIKLDDLFVADQKTLNQERNSSKLPQAISNDELVKKVASSFQQLENDSLKYLVNIYLHEPVYVDRKPVQIEKMNLNQKDETTIINKLSELKIIYTEKGIISIRDEAIVKSAINYMIDNNLLNIDKLINEELHG